MKLSTIVNPEVIAWQSFAEAQPPTGGDHSILISQRFHSLMLGWFYQGEWHAPGLEGIRSFAPENTDLWAEVADPQTYP